MWTILRRWKFVIGGLAALMLFTWVFSFLDPLLARRYEKGKAVADLSVPNWRRYTNNQCGFIVEFPSKPFETPTTLNGNQNVVSYRQYASTLERHRVFMVATLITSLTNNYTKEQIDLLLNKLAEGTLKGGGQLLAKREIKLGANPGKEVEIIMPDGNFGRMRFYQVGHNLQEVIATAPPSDRQSTNILHFLDSFKTVSE